MKGIIFHHHGGLEVLRYEDIPEPETGPGEVKVKVHAASLNHLDIWVLGGLPGPPVPMPHILGNDMAGQIAEVGEGVEGWSEGDRVVVSPGLGCGVCDYCLTGYDSACPDYKMIGYTLQGGWCEYQVVDARRLIAVNDRWSMVEWASAPLVSVTAWHMLFARAGLKCGEDVLVHAAGSGVGVAALQMAKSAGAGVIATAGTDEKCRKALKLGADHAINYSKQKFAEEVLSITGGRGVDVIIDHIGSETFQDNLKALAKTGRLVTCGATSGGKCSFDMRYLFVRQLSISGSYMGGLVELRKAMELMGRGLLQPVVDSVFPLENAADALQYMLGRKHFGKIVLQITD
jgi:NADPH:quinone reductase-like Zn-dependent oxidoreductase